ncbi:MAG: hypothetical protein Q9162_007098, partial [Coniocarpon cinnabarinum]
VQNAIEIAWNPSSDPSLKTQAHDFLNQLRANPSAWLVCLSLFTKEPRPSDVVRHMSLEIVNHAVQNQSLDKENATSAKIGLWNYVQSTYAGASPHPDSSNIQNKLAQTFTCLFAALYASGWGTFFQDFRSLAESDLQSGTQDRPGVTFYLRVLASVHDEIADQMIQTSAEKAKANTELKDLIRARDADGIAVSWQQILSQWSQLDTQTIELCLNVLSRWVSWTDIGLIANETMLQCLFQIVGQSDTGHPESGASKVRAACVGVFTELVAKKMKFDDKIGLIDFLNVETVVSGLIRTPLLSNTSSPDYDTDMAETVAKLVTNVILDVVAALNTTQLDNNNRDRASGLLQSFMPHTLRFLADEYDEVCSTIMPALTEQLTFFRKIAKSSSGLPSPYQEMLSPILDTLIAKMRYDDTSSWGEEDDETDEAEFQELRKRLKVAQQNVAVIDERLYLDTLARIIEASFNDFKQQAGKMNWRNLDVALLEMYMLGELAVRNSGLYQKKMPSSEGSQRLINLMTLMMDIRVSSFNHPTVQLQVMEICVRYHSFFEQRTEYLPQVLEDFVHFAHSDNAKVRNRAWHMFLRFSRTLRPKLGNVSQSIISALNDLLIIHAEVPREEDGTDSSSSSQQGPQDPTFQSQLFLFETVGCLASAPGLPAERQVSLLQPVLARILDGMKDYCERAIQGSEQAIFQMHHYIEATGTLARGVSDWVPGKNASPVPAEVSAEFQKTSEMILYLLDGLKGSLAIREASRFTFTRLVGVLGFSLLQQLPRWIDGLLSGTPNGEEIASFLHLLAQIIYGFKSQLFTVLDQLLSPFLDRVFGAFAKPPQGTDDVIQLGQLRQEYLQFLQVVLSNDLADVFISTTNQSKFDTVIATIEHFARDTNELIDARSAIAVLSRMTEIWGGPNIFTPSTNSSIHQASSPSPNLPGFDDFLITRFSVLTWTVMANPSFHPRDAFATRVVQEIAALQQNILTKTGASYIEALQQKQLPGAGLHGPVANQYLQSITTMDSKAFKQWLVKFVQQGPGG